MITTVTSVQRFATKTLYTRARATDGSTMLAPMSPGTGKGLRFMYASDGGGGTFSNTAPADPSGAAGGQDEA